MTQANALLAADQRGEELRYVTEHFRDLQGLRQAPGWAGLLVLSAMGQRMNLSWTLTLAGLAAVFGVGTLWYWFARRWYERRYGMVSVPDFEYQERRTEIISIFGAGRPVTPVVKYGLEPWQGWSMVMAGMLLFLPVPVARNHHANMIGLLMLLFFVLRPVSSSRTAKSAVVRLRRGLYIAGALMILGDNALVMMGVTDKWGATAMIGAVMVGLTLYDHWLFTRLLGERKGVQG